MVNSALTSLKFDKSPYQITLSYADFGILVKVLSTHVLEKIGFKTFIILSHINAVFNFVSMFSSTSVICGTAMSTAFTEMEH